MRRFLRGRDQRRPKQRGAVAIEFALSLIFIVPLLLGILDYGYYFWIGINAAEAARAGIRAAINSGGITGCPSVGTAAAEGVAAGAATAAVRAQMGHVFTPANAASYTTTPTNACRAGAPVSPTWQLQVQVDFPPAVGFLNPWMPASTRTTGYVRYRTGLTVSP